MITDDGRIAVSDDFGFGCPVCGEFDAALNVGSDHWAVCHLHRKRYLVPPNIAQCCRGKGKEAAWPRNEQILACYEIVEFLPEGVWSPDPQIREREYVDEKERRKAQEADEIEKERRHKQRCESVGRLLAEALRPVAADMTADREICVRVGHQFELTVTPAGIRFEEREDIPF